MYGRQIKSTCMDHAYYLSFDKRDDDDDDDESRLVKSILFARIQNSMIAIPIPSCLL